jgi:hypothetical protein
MEREMVTQERLGLEGRFQSFSIDIGCYAHLGKLQERFAEVDVSVGSNSGGEQAV